MMLHLPYRALSPLRSYGPVSTVEFHRIMRTAAFLKFLDQPCA